MERAGAEELRAGCWNMEFVLSEDGGGVSGRSLGAVLRAGLVSNLRGGIEGAVLGAELE
jgi:hypothetical protein